MQRTWRSATHCHTLYYIPSTLSRDIQDCLHMVGNPPLYELCPVTSIINREHARQTFLQDLMRAFLLSGVPIYKWLSFVSS